MSTKVIPLAFGLKIGADVHKEIEIRQALLGDMMDAENEASVTDPVTYRAALLTQITVRVGTFTGPLTVKMLRGLNPKDWRAISTAMQELENEGEDEQDSASAF
ncbi:phage tail assembly protein [Paludibacterium denitrificans]|uniref:Phage tail assembly protein n=1 Tax=Paludibacterium denitrificans TaxID=2675226 RepID=A0A844GAU7_9NEIS|nr:phage tail assembly protein [Paludibacterium denitrificans]MTD32411.1 hypothetical protein [Paludibacterium denitrificans]